MRFVSALVVVWAASSADAAGFSLDLQSGRATGLAGGIASFADDPSANYYNAAGLISGEGLDLQLGDTLIGPFLSFTDASGEASHASFVPTAPPHLHARFVVTPRIAVGLGVFSPFGAAIRWSDDWVGRAQARSTHLHTYSVNPNVAIQLHPKVRGGAGVNVTRGTLQLSRSLNFIDQEGLFTFGGGAWGWGLNIAAQVSVIRDYFEVGAQYRTGIPLTFDGRSHVEDIPVELANTFFDQKVQTTIRMPDTIYAGITSKPIPRLRLAVEGHHVSWSQLRQIDLRYEDGTIETTSKQWHDSQSAHLSGEYEVSDVLTVRAGFAWDRAASPAFTLGPDLPDMTRWRIGLGAGYRAGAFQVDAGYQLALQSPMTSTLAALPGTWAGSAHTLSVTVGYRLPGTKAIRDF